MNRASFAARAEATRIESRTHPAAGARGGEKARHAVDAPGQRLACRPGSEEPAAAARLATARPRTAGQGHRPPDQRHGLQRKADPAKRQLHHRQQSTRVE